MDKLDLDDYEFQQRIGEDAEGFLVWYLAPLQRRAPDDITAGMMLFRQLQAANS